METLAHNDLLALNNAIGEIYAARDLESFYQALFNAIQNLIPCELSSCADVGLYPARFLKMHTRTQEHSLVSGKLLPVFNAHLHEHPLAPDCFNGKVVKTTDYVSNRQFKDTAIHYEYYRHLDVDTQICFSVPVSPDRVSLLGLSRKTPDFSERDRLILTLLKPHLAGALRNVTEVGRMMLERDLLQKGAESEKQGTVLVQSDGKILCISAFAQELLHKYIDAAPTAGTYLPGRLLQWFNLEADHPCTTFANQGTASSCVKRVEREPLTIANGDGFLKIKLLHDFTTGEYILVIIERTPSLAVQNLQRYNLSRREIEVLTWLAAGKANGEIAVILGMSKRTTEKHLERIFAKLGVSTRLAATAILKGR